MSKIKKEAITNPELRRLIAFKVGKFNFEDITDEDIDAIREMQLSGYSLNGEKNGIELSDTKYFEQLSRLKISKFEITQDSLDLLTSIQGLQFLEFVDCVFDEDLDFASLTEHVKKYGFVKCSDLNFNYPKVRKIQVEATGVDFEKIDFSSAEEIFIENGTVKNVYDLSDFPNIKMVNFDGSKLIDKNGELCNNIVVSKNTIYTHLDEAKRFDVIK